MTAYITNGRRTINAAQIAGAIFSFYAGLFVHSAAGYGAFLISTGVAAGCIFRVTTPLYPVNFPRARFGAFIAAIGLVSGIATRIFVPAFGALLDATHHNYRLVCFFGSGMAIPSIAAMLVFHARFMALGGPKVYVAPE